MPPVKETPDEKDARLAAEAEAKVKADADKKAKDDAKAEADAEAKAKAEVDKELVAELKARKAFKADHKDDLEADAENADAIAIREIINTRNQAIAAAYEAAEKSLSSFRGPKTEASK